ncbi:cyanobactin maturation protease PatG family protein [Chitinophaga vietnamensis]|uniref:cyanobactin maturation protease PatG family protein n=1 Tax=Chitinophaga vietnamensis TaxID=2593957 RepID=UPI00117890C0|nr:hypothetical protein [Chitinophaga vietnamensis]
MKFASFADNNLALARPGKITGADEPKFDTARFLENQNTSYIVPQCSCQQNGNSSGGCTCGNGGTGAYVYTFGDIIPEFPSQSVENEFYQVAVTDDADKDKPFRMIAFKYLRDPQNLYIARELNWIFQIYGFLDLYAIKVTTNRMLGTLVESLAPTPLQIGYDILIGEKTNGHLEVNVSQELPYVIMTQLYSITAQEYVKDIIKATSGRATPEQAATIFSNTTQLVKNAGDLDKYRALNFLVLRYMLLYVKTWELQYANANDPYELIRVNANPVEVYGNMKIITVIFSYQSQTSAAMQNYACTVDVSNEFPFLVVGLAKYYPGI